MIDALLYTKKLEEVGIPRTQAEAHVQVLKEILVNDIATKNDLKELEYRLIIKLGTLMSLATSVSIAAITALVKLL